MLPAILSQMGPESLEHVKRLAYTGGAGRLTKPGQQADAGEDADADSDDEDVPDLVSNFDEASKGEGKTTDANATPAETSGKKEE